MTGRPGSFLHGLLALLLAALCSLLHAAPPSVVSNAVIVDPLADRMDLSGNMALLSDPQRQLVFTDVAARLNEFVPASRKDLVTSFNPGVFWLKLSLRNDSPRTLTRWLIVGNAKTQRVTFHLFQEDRWHIGQSGRNLPLLDKPVATLEPAFPVTLMPRTQVHLVLRIDSRGATDMATALWEPLAYYHASNRFLVREAALLGGLLVGSVLSLIVFVRLREIQYFWLGLTLVAIAGLEASRENLLGTFLWPAHLPLPPQALALFAVISIFSISMVATHALELAKHMLNACRLLIVLRWAAVAGFLVALFSYGHGVRIMSVASVIQNIAILLLCLLAWRRGQPGAAIFLFAFTLALLTEIARQLANLGLLPWIEAMDFSVLFFLLASPLILLGLVEQTRLLADRLQASEQLQQAKSAFLARISHELRSPLNTILGYSRMLSRGSARLKLSEGTAGIEKSTLRLLGLIDELLDEARAAAGQLTINPTATSLTQWFDEVAHTARMGVEAKGNRLVRSFSGSLPAMVLVDGKRLRQVLENLLNNANRHTERGIITLTCVVSVSGEEAVLDFVVEDTGEGIEVRRLQVIFEPFVRGPTLSAGHGLGLSICRELVRQMGGDIAVTSTPGRGSRFSFSLRCPLVSIERLPSRPSPDPAKEAAQASSEFRVLLVDDDREQLDLLGKQLEDAGFVVGCASGGRAAIGQLEKSDWSAVITDQMMPEVDGWAVLREVRASKPALPVILLSAVPPHRSAGFPDDMEFDAVLPKSACIEDVLATIWCLILKVGGGSTAPDWETLEHAASEGEVSGIEDWIAACRSSGLISDNVSDWIKNHLNRLDLRMIQCFARACHDQQRIPVSRR